MNFMFEWQEHKIHIFELTCNVRFIIDVLMTAFLTIFRRFPKILQNLSKGHTNVAEHFRKFPKIAEDCRRLPNTFEEDSKRQT